MARLLGVLLVIGLLVAGFVWLVSSIASDDGSFDGALCDLLVVDAPDLTGSGGAAATLDEVVAGLRDRAGLLRGAVGDNGVAVDAALGRSADVLDEIADLSVVDPSGAAVEALVVDLADDAGFAASQAVLDEAVADRCR